MSTLRIADAVGRVLGGRYRLIRPLGSGASAHVYVADDMEHDRRVAVKVLHPGLGDDQAFLRRFRAEATAIAALDHPTIVRVYDSGDDDGSPYVVSELLEGGSLRALLDLGHILTWSQATLVGRSVAEALQHAAGRGLVHRDIKPANLLFDRDGHLKVADFGLARALAEATWTDSGQAVIGSARYASPEQARGHSVDSRADVYALALVITEAVTDTVPFASDTTLGTLMARIARPLEVPESAGPLAPVLEAAGTIEPEDRLDPLRLARALASLASSLPPPEPLPLAGLPFSEPRGDAAPTRLTTLPAPNGDRSAYQGVATPPPSHEDPVGLVHQPPAVPVEPLPAAQLLAARRAAAEAPPAEPGVGPQADRDGEPTVAWRLEDQGDPRAPVHLYDGAADWETDDKRPGGNEGYEIGSWGPGVGAPPSGWGPGAGVVPSDWTPAPEVAGRLPAADPLPVRPSGLEPGPPPAWAPNGDEATAYHGDGTAVVHDYDPADTAVVHDYDPAETAVVHDYDEDAPSYDAASYEAAGYGATSYDTGYDDEDDPRRPRWLFWVLAAVILFVLSGGGTAAWIVTHRSTPAPAKPPPLAVVPSLRGDTVGKARRILLHEHLVLVVAGHSYDAHARSGTIVGGQAPAAGRRVRRQHAVTVTVSRGPRPVAVPSLRHLTRYRARRVLAAVGLKIGKITRTTSTTVPVNDIISATPSTGKLVPGQSVAIVISTGKPKVVVPLLQGKAVDSYAAAAAALKALHFATTEELVYNNTVPAGEVIVTDPLPHASVLYGSTVTVLVSKGADLVQVPNVQGDTVAKADQTLGDYGFVVSGVTGSSSGTVIGTDPPADSLKLYGSSVQIITRRTRAHKK